MHANSILPRKIRLKIRISLKIQIWFEYIIWSRKKYLIDLIPGIEKIEKVDIYRSAEKKSYLSLSYKEHPAVTRIFLCIKIIGSHVEKSRCKRDPAYFAH